MSDILRPDKAAEARRRFIQAFSGWYGVSRQDAEAKLGLVESAAVAACPVCDAVQEELHKLAALEAFGVDNWESYDDAMQFLNDDRDPRD